MPSPPDPATIRVAAEIQSVRLLAEFLRAECKANNIGELEEFDLELAMVEAANNIVDHGYAQVAGGEIELAFEMIGEQAQLTLSDWGKPVPEGLFSQCREVPLDAIEGRGIQIVCSCVDSIEYMRDGGKNRLRLRKSTATKH